ncbi:hypothetical protein DdX_21455 [Ditylenchus destructor]|uniref:Uncharacterized protein n=1 Tax=Ditylenchus destructor TaxID=166010 RepID=A0AAD4MEV1_9BILA|nr:hypothetical protein DdX_21455 [Ditylenchus destructor]
MDRIEIVVEHRLGERDSCPGAGTPARGCPARGPIARGVRAGPAGTRRAVGQRSLDPRPRRRGVRAEARASATVAPPAAPTASSTRSPSAVSTMPRSLSAISSAMRLRWSIIDLRRTSVGWAVSTGATSAWSSSSAIRAASTPCSLSLAIACFDIGARPRRHALPVLGQVGEHREQHEAAHENRAVVEVQAAEARIDAVRAGDAAMPVDRCRSDIFDSPDNASPPIGADHVAKDAAQIADVGLFVIGGALAMRACCTAAWPASTGSLLGRRQKRTAGEDQRQHRDDDRIPEAGVDVPGRRHHGEGRRRQEAAEPAIADMIGQRHGGVADAGREDFDQKRGDRAVDCRHQQHEPEEQGDDQRLVHRRRICLGWVAGPGQCRLEFRLIGGDHGGTLGRSDPDRVKRRMILLAHAHGREFERRRAGRQRRGHALVGDARLGEIGLGDVAARLVELVATDRVELDRADVVARHDRHRRLSLRCRKGRIGRLGQRVEGGEIADRGQRAAGQDDLLASDPVAQGPEDHKERRGERQRDRDQDVGGRAIDLQRLLQEEQRVELAGVPDHRLARDGTQQHDQHGAQLEADPQRHGEQQDRDEEGQAPAPIGERGFADRGADADHHQQRGEQAECRGGLDPAGEQAAFPLWSMLGHPERDEDDRGCDADAGVARQDADREGGQAHQAHGDEKGVFAPDDIAQPPEHQRTERTHRESRAKAPSARMNAVVFVHPGEEFRGDDRRQQPVQVEIIPFEHRAERRGDDHLALVPARDRRLCRHKLPPDLIYRDGDGFSGLVVEQREVDPGGAGAVHPDLARGGVREVDHAPAAERARHWRCDCPPSRAEIARHAAAEVGAGFRLVICRRGRETLSASASAPMKKPRMPRPLFAARVKQQWHRTAIRAALRRPESATIRYEMYGW